MGSGLITQLKEYENILTVVSDNFSKYLYMDAGSNVWLTLIKSKADEVSSYYPSFCAFNKLMDTINRAFHDWFVCWRYINLWPYGDRDIESLKDAYYHNMNNAKYYELVKKIKMLFKVIDKPGFELPLEILEYKENPSEYRFDYWITFLCEALKHIALDEDSYTKIGLCKHPGCNDYFIQTGRGSKRLYCLKHSPNRRREIGVS